jgi:small-conductance mechanosensitive channel
LLFWLKRRVLSVRSTGTQQFAGVEIFAPNSMAQAPLIFLAPQRVAPIRVMQIQQKIVLQPMPQPMPSGGSLRRNSEPYPGDGSKIYFVIFLSFFGVIFFCHFSFACHFFVISVLVCHVLSFFWVMFLSFRAIFSNIWKI